MRSGDGNLSITQLALELGFSKPSEFSRQYQLRFGELPSQTRRSR
jgi:transcriptional regulator GlxA family with amidase domain